jgi:putative lipase involved disintegration of autophagic bodies
MRNMQKATIYGLENKLYITCKILEDAMSWVHISDRLNYVWFFVCVCMWYTYLTHTEIVAKSYVQNQCG